MYSQGSISTHLLLIVARTPCAQSGVPMQCSRKLEEMLIENVVLRLLDNENHVPHPHEGYPPLCYRYQVTPRILVGEGVVTDLPFSKH